MALYDELGGEAAVGLALDHFYPKVLANPVVSPFFEGVDMAKLKERALPFVTMALGGPNLYQGSGLREVHKHLLTRGLDDRAFDAFVGLFEDVLNELGVAKDKLDEVMALLQVARAEVLNR